jgi:hypothetical protein
MKKMMVARAIMRRGMPTPRPIAREWLLLLLLLLWFWDVLSDEVEEVEDAEDEEELGVVELELEDVMVVELELEVEVLVEETDVLLYVKGICAKDVAIGFIANISSGVLQHAKLPTPVVPSSQQL